MILICFEIVIDFEHQRSVDAFLLNIVYKSIMLDHVEFVLDWFEMLRDVALLLMYFSSDYE